LFRGTSNRWRQGPGAIQRRQYPNKCDLPWRDAGPRVRERQKDAHSKTEAKVRRKAQPMTPRAWHPPREATSDRMRPPMEGRGPSRPGASKRRPFENGSQSSKEGPTPGAEGPAPSKGGGIQRARPPVEGRGPSRPGASKRRPFENGSQSSKECPTPGAKGLAPFIRHSGAPPQNCDGNITIAPLPHRQAAG
jgi:hypothetical protein